jgi:hypothetical protein
MARYQIEASYEQIEEGDSLQCRRLGEKGK